MKSGRCFAILCLFPLLGSFSSPLESCIVFFGRGIFQLLLVSFVFLLFGWRVLRLRSNSVKECCVLVFFFVLIVVRGNAGEDTKISFVKRMKVQRRLISIPK